MVGQPERFLHSEPRLQAVSATLVWHAERGEEERERERERERMGERGG